MILKRRETKSPIIGGFGTIKKVVTDKIKNTSCYQIKKAGNKFQIADSQAIYILNKPGRFKGLVEIIPLSIDGDAYNSAKELRNVVDKGKSFFIPLNALSYITSADAMNIMNSNYRKDVFVEYIGRVIKSSVYYGEEKFSWESK